MTALLSVHRATRRYGGFIAVDAVSLDVAPGEIHALIGPNGAGKTTLAAMITGLTTLDEGRIELGGTDITARSVAARADLGLARTFQISSVFPEFSALENVMVALQARQRHSFRFWAAARRDQETVDRARTVLDRIGLFDRREVPVQHLSYGEQRLVEIALAVAADPKVVVLDEPLAGMGPEEAEGVKRLLGALHGSLTMLLIEHDMDAVFRLADSVTVIEYGRVIASGTPSAIRADAEVRRAYLGEPEH
ncbi:MAG: ABC transporter ATP-binding protein [Lautropia sp.]